MLPASSRRVVYQRGAGSLLGGVDVTHATHTSLHGATLAPAAGRASSGQLPQARAPAKAAHLGNRGEGPRVPALQPRAEQLRRAGAPQLAGTLRPSRPGRLPLFPPASRVSSPYFPEGGSLIHILYPAPCISGSDSREASLQPSVQENQCSGWLVTSATGTDKHALAGLFV